ncbi:MAG: phosphotransferase family protein [Chitinophagaceae bacterium]
MQGRSKYNISRHAKLARQLVRHHFPKRKISIKPLGGGLTNYVYAVNAGNDHLVIRISDKPENIHHFQKEQWAVAKAKEKHVPVPDILEVGNSIIPLPYMISKKIEGKVATHHKCRLDIIKKMGIYAALIHTIPTKGYGHMFDWSENTLSKNDNWKDYLQCELKVRERLAVLEKNKMLPLKMAGKIRAELKKIKQWDQPPCLHHGDLRLKNVMVNDKGDITAIIDWENCISTIGSYWDTSIALHDLSIDAQWQYLEGYGLSTDKLLEISPAIKVFNLLNYAPEIEKIVAEKEKSKLDHYRLRLKGVLDLFSV